MVGNVLNTSSRALTTYSSILKSGSMDLRGMDLPPCGKTYTVSETMCEEAEDEDAQHSRWVTYAEDGGVTWE